jgi:hypothetical protein
MMHVVTAIWQSQQLVTTDMMADDEKEEQPSAHLLHVAGTKSCLEETWLAHCDSLVENGEVCRVANHPDAHTLTYTVGRLCRPNT